MTDPTPEPTFTADQLTIAADRLDEIAYPGVAAMLRFAARRARQTTPAQAAADRYEVQDKLSVYLSAENAVLPLHREIVKKQVEDFLVEWIGKVRDGKEVKPTPDPEGR